jgi:hypothetical protein
VEIAALAKMFGRDLYPWQQLVADRFTERVAGSFRRSNGVLSVPRQSGKTVLVFLLLIDRCMETAGVETHYTSQSFKETSVRFDDLARLLRASDLRELTGWPRVVPADGWDYRLHAAAGKQSVEFRNGSRLRIYSPRPDALHGSTSSLTVLDEARFHDRKLGDELLAACLPALSTTGGQVLVVSTAGDDQGQFMHAQLEQARPVEADLGSELFIGEWHADRAGLDGVTDPDVLAELVYEAHPAGGQRTGPSLRNMRLAARQQPRPRFLQEYGNLWPAAADVVAPALAIPPDAWARSVALEPMPAGVPCFGVDVHPDRRSAAIVAIRDGITQLVDHAEGADWVLTRVRELAVRHDPPIICLDEAGPAGNIAERLRYDLGMTIVSTNTRQWAQACTGLYDALTAVPPRVWHRPSDELDEAADAVTKRRLGSSWCLDRYSSSMSACLGALALAVYAQTQLEIGPEPSQIWV